MLEQCLPTVFSIYTVICSDHHDRTLLTSNLILIQQNPTHGCAIHLAYTSTPKSVCGNRRARFHVDRWRKLIRQQVVYVTLPLFPSALTVIAKAWPGGLCLKSVLISSPYTSFSQVVSLSTFQLNDTKLRGRNSQANYTDRATAACRRS
jgi:hypothetical protein